MRIEGTSHTWWMDVVIGSLLRGGVSWRNVFRMSWYPRHVHVSLWPPPTTRDSFLCVALQYTYRDSPIIGGTNPSAWPHMNKLGTPIWRTFFIDINWNIQYTYGYNNSITNTYFRASTKIHKLLFRVNYSWTRLKWEILSVNGF